MSFVNIGIPEILLIVSLDLFSKGRELGLYFRLGPCKGEGEPSSSILFFH